MTPEEADRKVEFILQMQAQFESNLGRLEADLSRSVTNLEILRDSQATLTASVVRIAEVLEESIKHTEEGFRQVAEVQRAAGDSQKSTDERLNALISIVEKHITGPDHRRKSRK